MGFDTIHDALQFVEQLAAGTDSLDTNTIGQQLRDLDVYLQQTLKPKARTYTATNNAAKAHRNACVAACRKRMKKPGSKYRLVESQ